MSNTNPKFTELKNRLTQIRDIKAAAAVLSWDQSTYMPPGGIAARGRQMATLRQIAHEKFTDPSIGELLEELSDYENSLSYESFEASLIRITRRDYQRAICVPADFMAKLSAHQSASYEAWTQAKPENNFAQVRPYLEKTLELSQELANFFPGYQHIADPLISGSDYGMTVAILQPLFAELRSELVPMVEAIAQQPAINDACLYQNFPVNKQLEFGKSIIEKFGYDFSRGRQDMSPHPFTTSFSVDDVRITTRIYENNLTEGLFSSLHEAGHAMYEQGISQELEGTLLASGISSGVHESQSRLWENLVGRSRGFWECFYPKLQGTFLRQLAPVPLKNFYQAINKVERTLIRTAADELTYNLHIMIRFDLELAMLSGKLAIKDLPAAWNHRYTQDLGITPSNDIEGVLQDVHWYCGTIGGMFQGYTLGNLISAQIFQAAVKLDPEIPVDIEQGDFSGLHRCLQENIYQYGRKFTATELIKEVTGKDLSIEPFVLYMREKYSQIYGIKL